MDWTVLMAGVTPSNILLAYKNLWLKFVTAAEAQTLQAKTNSPGGTIESPSGAVGPTTKALFFLPNWPYKSTSDRKRVDIVVQVSEIFSRTQPEISKSTTQVGYFERIKNGADVRPLLQLHYDFESPPPAAHPVFHAQLGDTNWPLEQLRKLGFSSSGEIEGPHAYKNVRIPSAFMGFGQILLALAADHLKSANYDLVRQAVRANSSCQWSAVCHGLKKSLNTGGYLHAHHWYDA